jgi:hypothetical protein
MKEFKPLSLEEHYVLAYLLEKQRLNCMFQISKISTKKERDNSIFEKTYLLINKLKDKMDDIQLKDFPEVGIIYYGIMQKIGEVEDGETRL